MTHTHRLRHIELVLARLEAAQHQLSTRNLPGLEWIPHTTRNCELQAPGWTTQCPPNCAVFWLMIGRSAFFLRTSVLIGG